MDLKLMWVVVASFAAIVPVQADVALGCDEGWYNYNGYCYLFYNTRMVTWQQASDECDRYDSSLLYFNDINEENWYISFVQSTSAIATAAYWTAVNDIPLGQQNQIGDGNWKWGGYMPVTNSLVTWNQSPANDGKSNCAGINAQGKMSDVDCNTKQGYVCQYDSTSGGCAIGWLSDSAYTSCYYVSNTTDPSQLKTWKDAQTTCQGMVDGLSKQPLGAQLLTIDGANDQGFVGTQLPYFTSNAVLHWTSLQYGGNNQWKWANGAAANTGLFQWAQEPDNVGGTESCAVIRYNGKFSDRDCNAQQYYVCKKAQDYLSSMYNLGCDTWTRAGQTCFMFYAGPLSTWQDARSKCQSIQGDLVNVKDADLQTWLADQMLDPANAHTYWTGLTDIANEGHFVWTDGTPINTNVVAWNQEPNDYKGQEDCGVLKTDGHFNDVNCQDTKAAAVCEIDNTPVCPTKGGTWIQRGADFGTLNNCYLFTNYKNSSALFLQSEAASFCKSTAINGTLVPFLLSIDSQAEKGFINAQLQKYLDNPYGYHTSLNDKQTEGFWTFTNSKHLSDDPNLVDWAGEPNNQTADTDCVNINYGGYYEVKKCSEKQSFICARPVGLAWTAQGGTVRQSPVYFVLGISLFLKLILS